MPPTEIDSYGYDESSHLIYEVSPSGDRVDRDFDGTGRVISYYDTLGNRKDIERDANGRIVAIEYTETTKEEANSPGGETQYYRIEYVRDSLGSIIEKHRIDLAGTEKDPLIEYYYYDSKRRLQEYTDADGNTTSFYRDLFGRVLKKTKTITADTDNPDGYITTCTDYNMDGKVVARYPDSEAGCDSDPNLQYTYTSAGQLYETIYPDGSYERRKYNAGNQLTRFTDRNGSIISNSYSASERLIARSIRPGINVVGTTSESYEYNGLGLLMRAITYNDPSDDDDDVVVNHRYDSLGRLLEDNTNGDVTSFDYSGEYMSRLEYPSGRVLDFARDTKGRLRNLAFEHEEDSLAKFEWLGTERFWAGSYGNGTSDAQRYDAFGRLEKLSVWNEEGEVIIDFGIERNGMNRPIERVDYLLGSEEEPVGDAYGLDELNRVLDVSHEVSLDDPTATPEWSESYRYDGRNNIIKQEINGVDYAFAVNNLDQYTSRTDLSTGEILSYSYDDAGNLIGKQSDEENELFSFNFRNQIGNYSNVSEELEVKYIYDALGRKRERIALEASDSSETVETRTIYRYAGWEIIEEEAFLDGDFQDGRIYVPGIGIDRPVRMDVLSGTMADDDGEKYYYHYDPSGNVHALTDGSGNVAEKYRYTAYGLVDVELAETNEYGSGNTVLYKGMRYDAFMKLYDSRLRWYDPGMGRFISVDPIGIWGDTNNHGNGYGFLGQNGYFGFDPFGLQEVWHGGNGCSTHWDAANNGNTGMTQEGPNVAGGLFYNNKDCAFWSSKEAQKTASNAGTGDIGDGGYTGVTEDGAGYSGDATEHGDEEQGEEGEEGTDDGDNDGDSGDGDGGEDSDEDRDDCGDGGCGQEDDKGDGDAAPGEGGYPADPTEDDVDFFDWMRLMETLFGESQEAGDWRHEDNTDVDGVRVDFYGVVNPPNSSGDDYDGPHFESDDTGHVWIFWNAEESDAPWDDMTTAEKLFFSGFHGGEIGPRPECISN